MSTKDNLNQLVTALSKTADARPDLLDPYTHALPDTTAAYQRLCDQMRAHTESPPWSERMNDTNITTDEFPSYLFVLVQLDGWRRVKRCARSDCRQSHIDPTNAAMRKFCGTHYNP